MKMEMKNLFQGNNKISKVHAMSSPNGASNSSGTYMNALTQCQWICICLEQCMLHQITLR